MKYIIDGNEYEVAAGHDAVVVDGREYPVAVDRKAGFMTVTVGDRPIHVMPGERDGDDTLVLVDSRVYRVRTEGRARPQRAAVTAPKAPPAARGPLPPGGVGAPMTGRVLRIAVEAGQAVGEGDLLLVLEAMKMENEIRAAHAGRVAQVAVEAGQRVQQGGLLVVVEAAG